MNANDFTVEEINLIGAFFTDVKEQTVENIFEALPDITNKDIKRIAENVIAKLERITDKDYTACDFMSIQA